VSRRSDEQLLRATRAGDAEAYGEFFARHVDEIVVFVRRRIGGAEAAADLTAETFAAALDAVHRGRAEAVRNPAAWLTQIAVHKLADSYRHARVADEARAALHMPALAVDAGDAALIDRMASGGEGLVEALGRLSPEERSAILARIVREEDYEQIAAAAGESQTTVRKRVSRGLARLRAEIGVPLRDVRPGATTIDASTALAEGWRPVALDSRGPFTLALFARGEKLAACLQGAAGGNAISMGSASPGPVPAGRIAVDDVYGSGAIGGPSSTAIEGRVASDVSGVSLTLSDGTTVQATVASGWFVAWWPSSARVRTALVASSDLGTAAQRLGGR